VPPVLHHALLGLSVAALAGAGLRAASPIAPAGLARAVTAATLATAAAVAEALALGLFALGGSTAALTVAALATYALAKLLLPDPDTPAAREIVAWWRNRSARERAAVGAVAGAAAAWAAWQLRHPALGFDTVIYHLPEIVLWVQHGTPGSIEDVLPGLPVGNYPLTAEVITAWGMGISRSFVPLTLFPWATLALTIASGWIGLKAVRVSGLAAGLALAALCTNPWLLAWQSNGSMTDPPALAWLVTTAALVALSRERPLLLAPAVVAAGLAIGCKTTVLPLTLVVVAIGLWQQRAHLRPLARPLVLATGAAAAVGGVWYLRDLVTHGSPFWPIVAAPWGDPVPPSISIVDTTFLDRLGPTLDRLGQDYLDRFGGGIVLLAGGALAALTAPRDRRVRWASIAAVLGFLLWARSPVTGVPEPNWLDEAIFSTTRYLLPVLAAAALALALAASRSGPGAIAARLVLAATAVVNLVQTFELGFPDAPAALTPLSGAVAGALAAVVVGAVARRAAGGWRRPGPLLAPAAAALAAAGLAAALAIPADGFLARHGSTLPVLTETITRWLAADPGYRSGDDGVATSPAFIGPLAGDRLDHDLSALAGRDSCATIRQRARDSWIVVYAGPVRGATPAQVTRCLGGARPAFDNGAFAAYPPGRLGAEQQR
jgi:hypothetical protein